MENEIVAYCAGRDRVEVRVTPKAASDALKIERLSDGTEILRVRVTVAPEDGRANKAVIALLAEALDVPKSALTLLRGEKSRTKTIGIAWP